jgi:hypothetical protein
MSYLFRVRSPAVYRLIGLSVGALFALALTAAASPEAGGSRDAVNAKTVVTGTVLLDPATPVCQVGKPCSKPLPAFKLDFSRRALVARVRTDSQGRYRASLPPGTYQVTAPAHKSIGRGLFPKRISVPAGGHPVRNFTYDAGIR